MPAEPDTGPSVGNAANITVGTQTAPAVAASDNSSFGCKVIHGHKIVTSFDYPPIPDRNFDWSAVLADYDGAPDATGPNSMIGRGLTELEAIANLMDMLHD